MNIFFLLVLLSCLTQIIVQSQSCSAQDPSNPLNDNSECKPCPDETPFWNEFSQTCVATCPSLVPVYDSLNWCSSCPSDYPLWNSTIRNCTKCPGLYKYSMYTGECVATCPAYAPVSSGSQENYCLPCTSRGDGVPYYDESKSQCVRVCEPPLFDSNNRCQPCEANTPYWDDPDGDGPSGQCVRECPLPRPSVSSNNTCQLCPISTPKWNNATKVCEVCPSNTPFFYYSEEPECVSRCADAAPLFPDHNSSNFCIQCDTSHYWDNISSECTTSCPRQTPKIDSNLWCTACPTATPKFDSTSNLCTVTCPSSIPDTDSDGWCVACSQNTPYWNTDNLRCEKCSIEAPYWDTSSNNGTCVTTCPVASPFADSDKWCMPCDSSNPYWDTYSSSGSCATACPAATPVSDTNKWCWECDTETPYWDSVTNSCQANCPSSRPVIDSNKWCYACPSTTPKWDPARSECVVTCPSETPATDSNNVCIACSVAMPTTPILDPSISSCVSSCEGLAPILNGNKCEYCPSNLPNWDSSIPACVSSCPVDKPYLNPYKWCKACEGATSYYNSLISTCVTVCPQTHPVVDNNKWCKACPIANPKWDPVAVACLTNCPAARPVITSYNWCQACPAGTPFWDPTNSVCVTSCPSSTPALGTNNWCKACLSSTPKWDSISAACVVNCPPARPVITSYNWCQACPAGTPFWGSTSSTCVAYCPPHTPKSDTNNWCVACPIFTPKWDSIPATCVANCPPSRPATVANNWCQACPAGTPYWDSTDSVCVASCPPETPMVDTNKWCQTCPSDIPYWDPVLASCISQCTRNAPSVDRNKHCHPCPTEFPAWNEITMQCLQACLLDRPVIVANNWCQECPSSTPYWDTINSVCVAFCPPQIPSVTPGNWCTQCTGASLKWNPISSQCVATCPKELPYFNKNSVPPACEQGPPVQNIVDFLESSGVVAPVALGGIQLAMPSLPYVAVTILLISLLNYVRYFNINFPAKITKVFQQKSPNVPSLNFGPFFPESWKLDTYSHPAPYRFAQYEINGLFVANFWRGITTALIMVFGVVLLNIIIRKKFTDKTVIQVISKAKDFLIWNYMFSFFISNIANLALYMLIEYQSLHLQDGLGIGSLLVNFVFLQIAVFGIVYMIKRINKFHKLNKQAIKNQEKLPIDQSIKVLLEKFNHDKLIQMLFIPLLCIRAIIHTIIISTVNNPIVECSLLIILNLIMIAYEIRYRPYRLLVDNIQIIGFESILLMVNITCLHLATLSFEEQFTAEDAGDVIVNSNIFMFILTFVFALIKAILLLINLIKERYRLKRPSSTISIQTDDSSAIEMTPSSAKCARLETAAGEFSPEGKNKLLSLSFAGSVSMEVGAEGELSPGIASTTRNLNNNNINRSFHIVRIPEGEDESQHLSRYADAGV